MGSAKDPKTMAQIEHSNEKSIEIDLKKDAKPKYTYTLEEAVEEARK